MKLTIKQIRMVKGLTQKNMADELCIHEQTYRKIENNPEKATIGQMKAVCRILDVDYNDIFFGSDSSLTRYTD